MKIVIHIACFIALLFTLQSCSSELKVNSVVLSRSTLELRQGEEYRINAAIDYEGAESVTLQWISEDETVATVDNTGLVIGLFEGSTIIKAVCSGVEAACWVDVTSEQVPEIPDTPSE